MAAFDLNQYPWKGEMWVILEEAIGDTDFNGGEGADWGGAQPRLAATTTVVHPPQATAAQRL
jgi:hypothetical protein